MFQKFNTDTLISRFIKNLIYSKPIPKYKFVFEGDWVTEDCYYCFGGNVIKCTSTGPLSSSNYVIVNKFYSNNIDITIRNNVLSKNTYYDYETHEQLGEYLRYLRGVYDIDLMPFYNCFSGRYVSTFSIKNGAYHEGIDNSVQIALFPIKYNRTYTIAIDCSGTVDILPVVLSGGIPLQTICNGTLVNLSDVIQNNYVQKSFTQFNQPFTFSVETRNLDYSKFLEQNERGLHLAIQLPISNISSIVVLEGDYTNTQSNKIVDPDSYDKLSTQELNQIFLSDLSLLRMNDTNSYAFSGRLVEYLLKNVIDSGEDIDGNIIAVQRALNILYSPYISQGVWDNSMRYDAFQIYKTLYKEDAALEWIDINGFIDKDVEKVLNKG